MRIAVREDEPAILQLLESARADFAPLAIDTDRVSQALASAFDRNGGLIAVIGPRDDVQALIFFRITQPWFSTDHVLEELCRIVRPDRPELTATLNRFADKCRDALSLPVMTLTSKASQEAKRSRSRPQVGKIPHPVRDGRLHDAGQG